MWLCGFNILENELQSDQLTVDKDDCELIVMIVKFWNFYRHGEVLHSSSRFNQGCQIIKVDSSD